MGRRRGEGWKIPRDVAKRTFSQNKQKFFVLWIQCGMNVYDLIINLLLMREFTANQNNNCSQI